jgi:quinol monooxygenase YgiN
MPTNWIPPDSLGALKEGFVVAITLEAKPGEEDAVAEIARGVEAAAMTEPKVKLFLTHRSPSNKALFFIFELYTDESGWAAHQETEYFKTAIEELLPRVARRERIPFLPVR